MTAVMTEDRARAEVYARSGGMCELDCGRQATDFSHRVAAGQLGQWTPWNGLHLCRRCHGWLHHHPVIARAGGWALDSGAVPELSMVLLPRPWLAWWLIQPGGDGGPHLMVEANDRAPVIRGGLGAVTPDCSLTHYRFNVTLNDMSITHLPRTGVLPCETGDLTATGLAWQNLLDLPKEQLYGRNLVESAKCRARIQALEEALIGAAASEDVDLCEYQCLSPVDVEFRTCCHQRVCAACAIDHDRECPELRALELQDL